MKAYIASALSGLPNGRTRIQELSSRLSEVGITCIQTWSKGDDADNATTARRDLTEIELADIVFVYAVGCEEYNNSGLHFEAGYALALKRPVVLIGPRLNIFYKLPIFSKFDNIDDFVQSVKSAEAAIS